MWTVTHDHGIDHGYELSCIRSAVLEDDDAASDDATVDRASTAEFDYDQQASLTNTRITLQTKHMEQIVSHPNFTQRRLSWRGEVKIYQMWIQIHYSWVLHCLCFVWVISAMQHTYRLLKSADDRTFGSSLIKTIFKDWVTPRSSRPPVTLCKNRQNFHPWLLYKDLEFMCKIYIRGSGQDVYTGMHTWAVWHGAVGSIWHLNGPDTCVRLCVLHDYCTSHKLIPEMME